MVCMVSRQCTGQLLVSAILPVNADDDGVQSKGRVVSPVLVPDLAALVVALMGLLEGIVDAGDDQDEPRDGGDDAQENHLAAGIRLLGMIGVDCKAVVSCYSLDIGWRLEYNAYGRCHAPPCVVQLR